MNPPHLAPRQVSPLNGLGIFSSSVDKLLRASEDRSTMITAIKQHWPHLAVLAISEWTSRKEIASHQSQDRSHLQQSLESALEVICRPNFSSAFEACFFDRKGWLQRISEEQRATKGEIEAVRKAFECTIAVSGLCELLMRCKDVSKVNSWLDRSRSFLLNPGTPKIPGAGERFLNACRDRAQISELLDDLDFNCSSKFLTLQQLGFAPSPESATVNVVFNLDRAEIPNVFALGRLSLELLDGSGEIMRHPETFLAFTEDWHEALAAVWQDKASAWLPGKCLVWRLQMEKFFEVIHGRSAQGSALAGLYCLSKGIDYPSEIIISATVQKDQLGNVFGIAANGSPGPKLEAIAADDSLTTVIVAQSTYAEMTSNSLKNWEQRNTKSLVQIDTCEQLYSLIAEYKKNIQPRPTATEKRWIVGSACLLLSFLFGGLLLNWPRVQSLRSPSDMNSRNNQKSSELKQLLSASDEIGRSDFVDFLQPIEPSIVEIDKNLSFESMLGNVAKKIIEDCRDDDITCIGVLEFLSISVDGENLTHPKTFKSLGGKIGARVAEQLELSLILNSGNGKNIDILGDATQEALDAGIFDHFSPQRRRSLLDIKYPIAWGSSKSKPNRLFTGEIRFTQQLDKMLVLIQSFDSDSQALQLESVFIAIPYWTELSEAGGSFRNPDAFPKNSWVHPLIDPAMPIEFTCLLNGKKSEIKLVEGEATIQEPHVGDSLEFKISRRDPRDDRPFAFVLKVNGLNTIEGQRASDLNSFKWALGPDDDEILIRGFYRDGYIIEPFRVLNRRKSIEFFKYLEDPGSISLTVFQQLSPWDQNKKIPDRDAMLLRHADRPVTRPMSNPAYRFALQTSQSRGLVTWGLATVAKTERLDFEIDPTPLFSTSVRYYQD